VIQDLDLAHQSAELDRHGQLEPLGRDTAACCFELRAASSRAANCPRRGLPAPACRRQLASSSSEALATAAAVGNVSSRLKTVRLPGCLNMVRSSGGGEIECALQGIQGRRALADHIGPEAGHFAQPDQARIRAGESSEPADGHEAGQRPCIDPIGLGFGTLRTAELGGRVGVDQNHGLATLQQELDQGHVRVSGRLDPHQDLRFVGGMLVQEHRQLLEASPTD
jgi:hypothetical protein